MDDQKTRQKVEARPNTDGQLGPRLWLHLVYPFMGLHGVPSRCKEIGEHLIVGRDAVLDERMLVFDFSVSRNHFKLVRGGGSLFIEDLKSTNGTFVNGEKVDRMPVTAQDVIRAGDCLFVVSRHPPQAMPELYAQGLLVYCGQMARAMDKAAELARDNRSVLLIGETGTGKDVLANYIHVASGREGPFVPVNCASIPETLAETAFFGAQRGSFTGARETEGFITRADHGTLFLDEIGELSHPVQAKLLRFLETREVVPVGCAEPVVMDVRVIAATNRVDASGRMAATLRSDIVARLEDEVLRLPPVRERREEIAALVCHAINSAGRNPQAVLDPEFMHEALLNDWPRNVRQLLKTTANCMRRLKREARLSDSGLLEEILGDTVEPPEEQQRLATPDEFRRAWEEYRGNVCQVARRFGIHRTQCYRWAKKYGLKSEQPA